MRSKQIRNSKKQDLEKRLRELRLELLKEHGNVKMGRPVKNTGKLRELKRTIAKIETHRNKKA